MGLARRLVELEPGRCRHLPTARRRATLQRRAHACRSCLRLASTHASLGPSVASASSLSHEKINLPRHPSDNLGELDPPGKAHALISPATIAATYSVAHGASNLPHPQLCAAEHAARGNVAT